MSSTEDPTSAPPTTSALDVVVPVALGVLVGAGVGVVLGRTVLAPKRPAPPATAPTVRPGGAPLMPEKGVEADGPLVAQSPSFLSTWARKREPVRPKATLPQVQQPTFLDTSFLTTTHIQRLLDSRPSADELTALARGPRWIIDSNVPNQPEVLLEGQSAKGAKATRSHASASFARSSINPFALFPSAQSHADIERKFGASWRDLLSPSTSPLWAPPAQAPSEACDAGPRRCPWTHPDPTGTGRLDNTAGSFRWARAGGFMPGGAQWFDCVQGAVPNCHFIAALQGIAMTMPQVLANRTRLLLDGRRQIQLFDGQNWRVFVLDEAVPVFQPNGRAYALTSCATSSRSNEQQVVGRVIGWPGLYEKVFAMAGLGVSHDRPNLLLPSYWVPSAFDAAGLPSGTPVAPITALTGQPTVSTDIHRGNVRDFWSAIQSLCTPGGMVVTPAHLGTVEENEADQWDTAQLVPSHAYSVCGWIAQNGQNYVVLRNAWGKYQPAGAGTLSGAWRDRRLGQDGLFAMEVSRAFNWYRTLTRMGG